MSLLNRPTMLPKLPPEQRAGLFRELFSFLAILIVGSFPQGLLLALISLWSPSLSHVDLLLINLFATVFMILSVCLLGRHLRSRPANGLGLTRAHGWRDYLWGAAAGVLMLLFSVLICILTESLHIQPSPSFPIGTWLLFLAGFLIQGASEELLCRGYLFPILAERYSLGTATVVNSLVFALLHLGNNGVSLLALCNVFLFGVVASLCVIRRGSLWLACGMHSLWNFTQGNLFGISVSGLSPLPAPLKTQPSEAHPLWNGGSFGLEGGLAVTLVLSLAILTLLLFAKATHKTNKK
ncbi:MAG: CPBP family intramembrane metalloprotease [Ruminococcaceae bacterium]|nr:CPBP family intramembrane metalloprotease [Oscillospiraceae bacterium]